MPSAGMSPLTYRDAGVDLDLYDQAMSRIPGLLARTNTPRVLPMPGSFAGLFRLFGDGHTYTDPVLVSGSDGVGTKVKVASLARSFDTVGIDLVAMCVNDCLCLGAEPLFFLDYLALGKDDPGLIALLVEGVAKGCVDAGAALLGGETAIMPDVYAPGDFDMAGFCVGVVERTQILDGSRIRPGDQVIGVASSGLHSNGYSLVRKIVFDAAGLSVDDHVPELGQTVGEALLTPTRIYARLLQAVRATAGDGLVGVAHITGGGLAGNAERVLPPNCRLILDRSTWRLPAVFEWLGRLGRVDREEMHRVFNMGIGLVCIVQPQAADRVRHALAEMKADHWTIGEVVAGEQGAEYVH